MTLLDDQGRLFGRWNMVDVAVIGLLGTLIPMAYGAWLLFAPRPPVLLRVTPYEITPEITRVTVEGRNLRPYLRMTLNDTAVVFSFTDPNSGAITLSAMSPGVYDLVLLDEAQELTRLPHALVVWPALIDDANGRFVIESDELVHGIRFTIIRDRVTHICERYRQMPTQAQPESQGVATCRVP